MDNPHLETALPEISMIDDNNDSCDSNNDYSEYCVAHGDETRTHHFANPSRNSDSLTLDEGPEDCLLLDLGPHSPMALFDQSFETGQDAYSSACPMQPETYSSSSDVGGVTQEATPSTIHSLTTLSSGTPHRIQAVEGCTSVSLSSAPGNSLSRRRGGSNGRRRGKSAAATSVSTSSAMDRQRTGSSGAMTPAGITVIEEELDSGSGLRASLDAGMAAVRSWIRLRSGPDPRSGNFASIQHTAIHPDTSLALASPAHDVSRSEVGRIVEDGLLSFSNNQVEDGATSTSSSSSLDDFISSAASHRYQSSNVNNAIVRSNRLVPSTILEEQIQLLQSTIGDTQSVRSPRQRALSEPDAVTVRDFLFQRALCPQRGFRRRRYTSGTLTSINSNGSLSGGAAYPGHNRRPTRGRQSLSDSNNTINNNGVDLSVTTADNVGGDAPVATPSQLSNSASDVLFASSGPDADISDISTVPPSLQDEQASGRGGQSNNSVDNNSLAESDPDPQREARARWININRRFQVVITIVALIFSLLLFAILVCWVVLTSAYVISMDKSCDVPLKAYFWLVTLQLVLDVFRTDIMRLFFRWDSNSNQRIPCRVITYNVAYLTYALLVLRLGIQSVFVDDDTTCSTTAPELFQSSVAFVSLSIAAWATIVLGYLVPFCFVATLLTLNGYMPTTDSQRDGATGPFTVFPTAMAAPPGCVDQLRTVRLNDLPSDLSKECCICMEDFTGNDTIVKTACNHLYHRQCLADWLRHARTCPVCRMDIPSAVEDPVAAEEDNTLDEDRNHAAIVAHGSQSRLGLVPATRTFGRNTDIHHEVVSLLHIIRRSDLRNRQSSSSGGVSSSELRNRSGSIEFRNRSRSASISQVDLVGLEEGRNSRQY